MIHKILIVVSFFKNENYKIPNEHTPSVRLLTSFGGSGHICVSEITLKNRIRLDTILGIGEIKY
jgi:hypothetical protein